MLAIAGRVNISGKLHAFVWVNSSEKVLLLRGRNRISAEHAIIEYSRRENVSKEVKDEYKTNKYG